MRRSRSTQQSVCVRIKPDQTRTPQEQNELRNFREKLGSFSELEGLVQRAASAMGIDSRRRTFARDVLSIEVTGPNWPHLTLIDLPGLIQVAVNKQTDEDVTLVSDLVSQYIKKERTVILAVVGGHTDYPTQSILKLYREVDPDRIRTLGIITKPDLLTAESRSEASFIRLAMNKDERHQLKLGWHVLKNRGDSARERNYTTEQRNFAEKEFFSTSKWNALPSNQLGVQNLRSRLSNLLVELSARDLPKIRVEIQNLLTQAQKHLKVLGTPRHTPELQRIFLTPLQQEFYTLCDHSTSGHFVGKFFKSTAIDWKDRRLRSKIMNQNDIFNRNMLLEGHSYSIEGLPFLQNNAPGVQKEVKTKEQAIAWVKERCKFSRGTELPETYNPRIISELFWDISSPWEEIARNHIEAQWEHAKELVQLGIYHVAPPEIAQALLLYWIDNNMEKKLKDAKDELASILQDSERDAMTLNQDYTKRVQEARTKRTRENSQSGILGDLLTSGLESTEVIENIFQVISCTQDDTDTMCSNILDCMLSYYEVPTHPI